MLSATELRHLELAKRMSWRATFHRCRLGAVIARRGQVLGVGYNQKKTHTRSPSPYKYLHAEVDATLGIPLTELRGASIYVYRETLNGDIAMAKPCSHCEAYLRNLGLHAVYHTTNYGFSRYIL